MERKDWSPGEGEGKQLKVNPMVSSSKDLKNERDHHREKVKGNIGVILRLGCVKFRERRNGKKTERDALLQL